MDASQVTYSPKDVSDWAAKPTEGDAALDAIGDSGLLAGAWSDNAVLRGDGTTGIQGGSGVTLSDTAEMLGLDSLVVDTISGGDAILEISGKAGVGAGAAGDLELWGGQGDIGASGVVALKATPSLSGTNGSAAIDDWTGTRALQVTNDATPTVTLGRRLISINLLGEHHIPLIALSTELAFS